MEFVENENLRKALLLRKEGNPEALTYLNRACDEGDGKAWYFKGRAYQQSGFFLESDFEQASICFRKSSILGCPWGTAEVARSYGRMDPKRDAAFELVRKSKDEFACALYYSYDMVDKNMEFTNLVHSAQKGNMVAQYLLYFLDENLNWLEMAAWNGEPCAQKKLGFEYKMAGDYEKAFYWSLKAAKQNNHSATVYVAKVYRNGDGCKISPRLSAFYMLKSKNIKEIRFALRQNAYLKNSDRLQELFVYGKSLKFNPYLVDCIGEEWCLQSIRIYDESTIAARQAALCFLLFFRRHKVLSKDVQRIIAKLVYDSRENPMTWGVSLE